MAMYLQFPSQPSGAKRLSFFCDSAKKMLAMYRRCTLWIPNDVEGVEKEKATWDIVAVLRGDDSMLRIVFRG